MNAFLEKYKGSLNVVIAASALIICVSIVAAAFVSSRSKSKSGVMTVWGVGSKNFTSDIIVWEGNFIQRSTDLSGASRALQQNKETIRKYLLSKGIAEKEIVFSSIEIGKEFEKVITYGPKGDRNESSRFAGYKLSESVSIESREVDKVEGVSRSITELINTGVELISDNPRYYYSKLPDLKLEMVAQASKDARERAEAIASKAKARLGRLLLAETDVFQIKAKYSTQDDVYGGVFDTSSKEKTASITIKIKFALQ
ncbi:MAG: SIMPL domain-containing protein [Spirochaetia bacterium]|nr:SIMPL domain-containing protein [Spirochaetia bacterium]